MEGLLPVLVIVGVLAIVAISAFNGLVNGRNRVDEALGQIQVQLKRRYDLIPNLVDAVKGQMGFEKGVLEGVTAARAAAVNAGTSGDTAAQAKAENMLTSSLRTLFANVEAYPTLKSNENVIQLQEQLTSTENQIGFSRQHYNATVLSYNNAVQTFPGLLFAGAFGFAKRDFFDAPDAEEAVPKVNLS
jgi:LemA protein